MENILGHANDSHKKRAARIWAALFVIKAFWR